MKVSTKFSEKVFFFSVIPIDARFLDDPLMFNKDSMCTSYHIYPNSMDLMLVFILEAARAAGSSRFNILDLSTNNFFSSYYYLLFFY